MEISVRNLKFSFHSKTKDKAGPDLLAGEHADSIPFSLAIPKMELKAGSHHAWVGPSGSGKTTALRLLAGILQPDQCETLRLGTQEISQMSPGELRLFRARNIGLVFQDFKLLEYLNVRENILLPTRLCPSNASLDQIKERAVQLLDRVGLSGKQNRNPTQLSQGEQQRVAICRALALRPQLILADEPTGNLDPASKTRIMELLRHECREIGATLLVVTHDHALLEGMDSVTDFSQFYSSPQERRAL